MDDAEIVLDPGPKVVIVLGHVAKGAEGHIATVGDACLDILGDKPVCEEVLQVPLQGLQPFLLELGRHVGELDGRHVLDRCFRGGCPLEGLSGCW